MLENSLTLDATRAHLGTSGVKLTESLHNYSYTLISLVIINNPEG